MRKPDSISKIVLRALKDENPIRFDNDSKYDSAIIGMADGAMLVYSKSKLIELVMVAFEFDDPEDALIFIDDYKESCMEKYFDEDDNITDDVDNESENLTFYGIPVIIVEDYFTCDFDCDNCDYSDGKSLLNTSQN